MNFKRFLSNTGEKGSDAKAIFTLFRRSVTSSSASPGALAFTTPCLYADDAQIFTSSFDIDVLANNINSDLKSLSDWLTVNKLQFHPLKTKLMVVGSTYNLNTKSEDLSNVICIDNNLVSLVTFNKCLGVLLDEKLAFETHIEYISKRHVLA